MDSVTAEVGTTGVQETVELTDDARDDVGRAVELEHPRCEESHCEIAAAIEAGEPIVAAFFLTGATEAPLLGAVLDAHGYDMRGHPHDIEGWQEWEAFHREYGVQCAGCESFNYGDRFGMPQYCSNCLAYLSPFSEEL